MSSMYKIPLEAIPNQRLSVDLDDGEVEITVKTVKGLTLVSITNHQSVIAIPNRAMFFPQLKGKLGFICQDDEYPTYKQFGNLHNLYYISESEYGG